MHLKAFCLVLALWFAANCSQDSLPQKLSLYAGSSLSYCCSCGIPRLCSGCPLQLPSSHKCTSITLAQTRYLSLCSLLPLPPCPPPLFPPLPRMLLLRCLDAIWPILVPCSSVLAPHTQAASQQTGSCSNAIFFAFFGLYPCCLFLHACEFFEWFGDITAETALTEVVSRNESNLLTEPSEAMCVAQEQGLIVMQINSADKTVQAEGQVHAVQDPNFSQVWVLLNAKPKATCFSVPAGEVSWPK